MGATIERGCKRGGKAGRGGREVIRVWRNVRPLSPVTASAQSRKQRSCGARSDGALTPDVHYSGDMNLALYGSLQL